MSIRESLVTLAGGETFRPVLTWDEVATHLRDNYLHSDSEQARKKLHNDRHDLYEGGGRRQLDTLLEKIFLDPQVRHLRQRLGDIGQFNNVMRRVILEISTVYAESALREVAEPQGNANYQVLQRQATQDQHMRTVNRWLNLHREVLLGFRVREERTGRVPVIDIAHPGQFSAISHPLDHTWLLGVIIDHRPTGFASRPTDPHFLVWTDDESFFLDEAGRVIVASVEENPFDRMPWLLAHAEPPTSGLLDSKTGEDLKHATLAVWLENVLLLKESKSANKQVIFQGDTGNIVRGQPQDGEHDLDVGEGVTTQTVDRGMDLSMFRDTADFILERVAANYGIPPAILQHHGATSGFEIKLRRVPISELRSQQEVVFREVERDYAEIQSMVAARDLPELAFDTTGWRIDFGQMEAPQSEVEELNIFEKKRDLGLTSTVDMVRRLNPDLDDAGALAQITEWADEEETRTALVSVPMPEDSPELDDGVPDEVAPATALARANGGR